MNESKKHSRLKAVLIYITAGNVREAEQIGQVLVGSRLAACVNILDGMRSFYWWKGKMEKAKETVLIAKTGAALADAVIKKVKSMHSYSCPCILVMPVVKGNPDYLRWIVKESKVIRVVAK